MERKAQLDRRAEVEVLAGAGMSGRTGDVLAVERLCSNGRRQGGRKKQSCTTERSGRTGAGGQETLQLQAASADQRVHTGDAAAVSGSEVMVISGRPPSTKLQQQQQLGP